MLFISGLFVIVAATALDTFEQDPYKYDIANATYASGVVPGTPTTYAPDFNRLSTLIPYTTTTYALYDTDVPSPSDSETYGQYAWSKLWDEIPYTFTSKSLYSTTVEPTVIPTNELVLPPDEDIFEFEKLPFPKDFMMGVAASAIQIEGALKDEGRGPSFLELNFDGKTNSTHDASVADENYYLYKQDIARLAAIGVEHYSFSISWSRILPFGKKDSPVNQIALEHYNDVINTCIKFGITPIVTLTHYDTPLNIVDVDTKPVLGGFSTGYSQDEFIQDFVYYGKVIMSNFADRVPIFITLNQPSAAAENVQGMKNFILAHAQLHDFYHHEIKGCGKVGLKLSGRFAIPYDDTPESIRAANRYQDFIIGTVMNPLALGEDFPESFKATFPNDTQHFFTSEELKQVVGRLDFLGIDSYTSVNMLPPPNGIDACQSNSSDINYPTCLVKNQINKYGWAVGYGSQYDTRIVPKSIREYFKYLYTSYETPLIIAEFGFPEWEEELKSIDDIRFDLARSIYFQSYMEAALQAIHYDGVDIIGSLAWAFVDTWEFGDYKKRFGLQYVDRETQERSYKKSLFDYVRFFQKRKA